MALCRSPEKNFLLVLAYEGTDFSGWQRQADRPSLQGTLEKALERLYGRKSTVYGCGRTDAGVHALGYTANAVLPATLPPARLRIALNALLPATVRVRRVRTVADSFHSRYDARSKVYRYLVTGTDSPFFFGRVLKVRERLDEKNMRKAARILVGTHDFSSFQGSGSSARNPVRTVRRIAIRRERCCADPQVRILAIEIEADGFLYRMARNMVGALLEVGRGRLAPSGVREILKARDRRIAPGPAPAHGLYLRRVRY